MGELEPKEIVEIKEEEVEAVIDESEEEIAITTETNEVEKHTDKETEDEIEKAVNVKNESEVEEDDNEPTTTSAPILEEAQPRIDVVDIEIKDEPVEKEVELQSNENKKEETIETDEDEVLVATTIVPDIEPVERDSENSIEVVEDDKDGEDVEVTTV